MSARCGGPSGGGVPIQRRLTEKVVPLVADILAAYHGRLGKRRSTFARMGSVGKGLTKRHEVRLTVRDHEATYVVPSQREDHD